MASPYLILKCEFTGRYVAALSGCAMPEVVAERNTLPEAFALADELNAAADGAQRQLILASDDARRAAA